MADDLFQAVSRQETLDGLLSRPSPPATVRSFLGRLYLLHGVPIQYLIPNEAMLPAESLKFFHIDREWVETLILGALSVGRQDDVWPLQADTMAAAHSEPAPDQPADLKAKIAEYHAALKRESDARDKNVDDARIAARDVRASQRHALGIEHTATAGAESPDDGENEGYSGFLLRSRILTGWPGTEIVANGMAKKPLTILRLERVGDVRPEILFGLVRGQLRSLVVSQPPEGLHFHPGGTVPFRTGGDGTVIDVKALARARAGSAAFAREMMAQPVRWTFNVKADQPS